MSGSTLQQHCWNHETREAVCRCPACGRSFCRECVTEHESRLLCARCLEGEAQAQGARRHGSRKTILWMAVAGLLLAWIFFYGTGQALILITGRMEQTSWQSR
jgi:hypothetical protein